MWFYKFPVDMVKVACRGWAKVCVALKHSPCLAPQLHQLKWAYRRGTRELARQRAAQHI